MAIVAKVAVFPGVFSEGVETQHNFSTGSTTGDMVSLVMLVCRVSCNIGESV